jgi:prepilin-type N-terminal cleavage/methylation domain-containing protein
MLARKQTGFTIVELLIVIVVIAILATISIVAYNGIQGRANDSAVRADITNFVKKVHLYEADHGAVPVAGSVAVGDASMLPGIKFSPSKSSYAVTEDNFYYCSGKKSSEPTFAVVARSKSNTLFIYRPEEGLTSTTTGWPYVQCTDGFDAGTSGYSYGYNNASNKWWSWTSS